MACRCNNKKFEERLNEAINNIQDKLRDKDSNNIFFLTLFELPYIFCDGKLIAGFCCNESMSSEKIGTSELLRQPLNTLHLTERVIKNDRFVELLRDISLTGKDLKGPLFAAPGLYEINNNARKKKKFFDYLGLIPVAGKPSWGQYNESDKARVKFYILKFHLLNSNIHLYIIWSNGQSQNHRCLKERYKLFGTVNLIV